ncbi:MAG: UDP-glucose--hexose-1-phosphate uridylyltransferase [Chloroherpetonaceae bacterium]|nr:UDP-glucose--hexose-1-phosphate uridylyltransferase [Chloroherpetonaceae bacterium]
MKEFSSIPHRRYNPLTGEYILVSPHRNQRPWQGKIETAKIDTPRTHDPLCYLCPGNTRANGEMNPNYTSTYSFTNDFSAILPNTEPSSFEHDLLKAESVQGTARVICFSPNHSQTMAEMSVEEISAVIDLWQTETEELSKNYRWIQIFENKGEMMGCSNPHPHGQIWAMNSLPTEAKKEDDTQKEYFQRENKKLLMNYLSIELEAKERVILENEHWAVVVPFWAAFPFETLVLPKAAHHHLLSLSKNEKKSLAKILKELLMGYDRLFDVSFPYSMGWHQAPFGAEGKHWQLHAHFYPPLLRSATVRKHIVGFELLSELQRDMLPETAAQMLRESHQKHFKSE